MGLGLATMIEKNMTSLLALDLGTTTGWAVYRSGHLYLEFAQGHITSGVMSFACDRYSGGGMRFLRFRKWLDEIKALNNAIGEVYFEEVRRHVGTDASHVYGGFMAHLTTWCEQEGIPYEGVPVGTIKKFMTGNGSASKEKMIEAIREKGHVPQDNNEADALALLYWRLFAERKRHDPA